MKTLLKSVLFLSGLCGLATTSHAALITQFGDNVSFTYDDSTPFGTGSIVGDALSFNPVSFIAEATGSNDSDYQSLQLAVRVQTLSANTFVNLVSINESGDYRLMGPTSSVSLNASLNIDLDQDNTADIISPFGPNTSLTNNDGNFHNWSAQHFENLSAFQDNSIDLVLTNNLAAFTFSDDSSAFIQKKLDQVGIAVNITPVPLPATGVLLGSALIGLLGFSKRKAH